MNPVKVLVNGALNEHPVIFRSLDELKLRKFGTLTSSVGIDQGIQKPVDRVITMIREILK